MTMHPDTTPKSSKTQRGVGLIEILVALLIVTIGFLGVAALQVATLSTNNSAMARSMAVVSLYSMVDILRLDKTAALAGHYDGSVTADNCPAAGTFPQTQLNQWCEQLASNLGAASTTTGAIDCVSNSVEHGYCTVTIKFADDRSGIGGGLDGNGITTIVTKTAI